MEAGKGKIKERQGLRKEEGKIYLHSARRPKFV